VENIQLPNQEFFVWVILAFLDSDPQTQLNPDLIRIQIRNTSAKNAYHSSFPPLLIIWFGFPGTNSAVKPKTMVATPEQAGSSGLDVLTNHVSVLASQFNRSISF
jgi:hypothetical protein